MHDLELEKIPREPSIGLTLVGFLTVALIFGGLLAQMIGHFVPSSAGKTVGIFAAGMCCAVGAYYGARPVINTGKMPAWARPKIVRGCLLGVLFFALGWQCTVEGLLPLVTFLIGKQGSRTETVSGWRSARRLQCAGPDIVGLFFNSPICIDSGREAEFPPGSKILLHGISSEFGINVAGIEDVESNLTMYRAVSQSRAHNAQIPNEL